MLLTLAGWTSPKIAEAFGVREIPFACGAATSPPAGSQR